ncbi:Gp49 family protein [Klebsiella aerogenes]|uniref:Gp49 family protein n=1 Tax=Klebsiella aerogenes TaxID=548 RepID=UPI0013FD58DF|nr:Gp49 family protein [Klebsiella aerogenes]
MNDQQIEKQIVAKGKTAPRVTPSRVEAIIRSEHYFTAYDGRRGALANETYEAREKPLDADADLAPLQLLTFCVLVLENGFTVTGESACASPENFDAVIGRNIARQNAVNKIWLLEGYLLKQRLFEHQKCWGA